MSSVAPQIPGLVLSGNSQSEPPLIVVVSPEKAGKSSLAVTLFNFPFQGAAPLVVAWDPSGPDSCAKLGYPVPVLKVRDEPGDTWYGRANSTIAKLETAKKNGGLAAFGSIVIDCASTMGDRLFEDSRRLQPSKDPRQNYGAVLEQMRTFMYRVIDLGLPSVWLAWLKEPGVDPQTHRPQMGGPQIVGSFRTHLAGKATHILFLEKAFMGKGAPDADQDGFVRRLHTRPYQQINCDGRLTLPEPCGPNLAYVLAVAMGLAQ